MDTLDFNKIRELKQQGKFIDAWNYGYPFLKDNKENTYLRTSLFWVCYSAIKSIQEPILARQNKAPNFNEQKIVNSWISCIGKLHLPIPCDELDYRFFNLFRGCGEHYQTYIKMLIYYGPTISHKSGLEPYKNDKGESPSLLFRLARQVSKAWLQHNQDWGLNLDGVLNFIEYTLYNSLDSNKMWLQFDKSKCLVSANRYKEAREAAIVVLRKKISESWAWGALADTYFEEEPTAAISCYCKGIKESHDPVFCIPMYYSLAKLFAQNKNYNLASVSLSQLIEIYDKNGWNLKPEHENLIYQEWFNASAIETINFREEIKSRAQDAVKYATKNLEITTGIVISHHRSGKGFDIYIGLNKKLHVRKSIFWGKKLPEIGSWLEIKIAEDNDILEVLEAHKTTSQISDVIVSIEGVLKLNSKGFGFIDDAFIPPYLLKDFVDQEYIRAIKIWDIDPKKNAAAWRVIKLERVESSN